MTNKEQVLKELLAAPDTIGFFVRRSEYFNTYIESAEKAAVGQLLGGGRYALVYVSQNPLRKSLKIWAKALSEASL